MTDMTAAQKQVYEFVKEYIAKKGYSPSIREIGKGTGGRGAATTKVKLEKLREHGYVDWIDFVPRTIRILK